MLYGLVKPRGHGLTFVGVTLDGHTYCLEKKGEKGGPDRKEFKCQDCKSWLRTDGVVLHKMTCKHGPSFREAAREAVVNWALFVVHRTSMSMLVPFQAYGRLCGLELTEEDLNGRDDMEDMIEAGGQEKADAIWKAITDGCCWVRRFNRKHPAGPKYQVAAPNRPVRAIQVPAAPDDATTLANIEKTREKASKRLNDSIKKGRVKVAKLIDQTAAAVRKIDADEDELRALMAQYDAQRDAILNRAPAVDAVPVEEPRVEGAVAAPAVEAVPVEEPGSEGAVAAPDEPEPNMAVQSVEDQDDDGFDEMAAGFEHGLEDYDLFGSVSSSFDSD
jgi:hypothetical protein